MNIDLDFAQYAEAYRTASQQRRAHSLEVSGSTTAYRWVDDGSEATAEDLHAEVRALVQRQQEVHDAFQANLEEALVNFNGFPTTVAARIYSQTMTFAEDSYECVTGSKRDEAYWAHLATRAQELAEFAIFAAHEIK